MHALCDGARGVQHQPSRPHRREPIPVRAGRARSAHDNPPATPIVFAPRSPGKANEAPRVRAPAGRLIPFFGARVDPINSRSPRTGARLARQCVNAEPRRSQRGPNSSTEDHRTSQQLIVCVLLCFLWIVLEDDKPNAAFHQGPHAISRSTGRPESPIAVRAGRHSSAQQTAREVKSRFL